MKKRILLVLTVLTMLLCVPIIASAQIIDSGECGADGDNVTWTFDNEGTLTISGEGDMKDYSSYPAPWWYDISSKITKVIIEQGVTSIGYGAFYNCSKLTGIDIPTSVTSIGGEAFEGCESLTSVTVPDSVTSIGNGAFFYCMNLQSIHIPNGVTSIGNEVFSNCESLTSIKLPDGVTSIGDRAFAGCGKLTSVNIPDSVTDIAVSAFFQCGSLNINVSPNNQNYCDIDGVLLTKDKKTILAYAKDVRQPEYIIPNSVTSIGYRAFYQCENLTSVKLPNGVTSIGSSAFYGCESLTDVRLPDSVTNIGDSTFRNCSKLTEIIIPDGVTSIDTFVFDGCKSLTSVTIPKGMTNIGPMAFGGCASLTDVYYLGTEQEWLKLVEINQNHGHDKLFNATIHFIIKPLEVQPVEPEKDAVANKITIPVTVTNETRAEELNDVILYIAEYNADGRLTNVTFGEKGTVEGDTVIFTADIPDAENYKIMLWDGNNAPLMDAVDNI